MRKEQPKSSFLTPTLKSIPPLVCFYCLVSCMVIYYVVLVIIIQFVQQKTKLRKMENFVFTLLSWHRLSTRAHVYGEILAIELI